MKDYRKYTTGEITKFQRIVYDYYQNFGRDLPWRSTDNPYEILVSEIMLQQTQVSRVVHKYVEFIKTFPDIKSLAEATLRYVLTVWQGLGYNRRALSLKRLAEIVNATYGGYIPSHVSLLMQLPGIGNATANAVCAFAFNQPVVFIETNVRTVFIYHFFGTQDTVKDSEIRPLVERTLDYDNPKHWYNALMDYGVALKKYCFNPGRKSAHHKEQSPFEGSARQIRGVILRALVAKPRQTFNELIKAVCFDPDVVKKNIQSLEKEGLVKNKGRYISIP
ncbi:MAG: A/G-specific adenine glycosylase [Deltaproteobacteria bacterium]|nr:A/G-specific adenine glycosylase [Deltaproteobacteria bacterium]